MRRIPAFHRGASRNSAKSHHVRTAAQVRIFAFCAILIASISLACAQGTTDTIAVMTFNVRYGTADDSLNSWPHRKDIFIDCIRNNRPDILCVQEALDFQIAYVQTAFPTWCSLGLGRYQGVAVPERPHETMAGESCNILYDSTKFDLEDGGTFWHSDTPEIPASMTWGNALPRITTWGRFKNRTSGHSFVVMNTHFHWGEPYVSGATELHIRRWGQIAGALPTILTGDFNLPPDSHSHKLLCGEVGPPGLSGGFKDCWQTLGYSEANAGTSNGFSARKDQARIDWILVSKHITPLAIQTIYYNEHGRYPSDHYPVRAELKLSL